MIATNNFTIWNLIDDRAGNQSQCLGVGEALGLKYEIRDLKYTPAAALPNFVMGKSFGGLTASSRVNLVEPWPDIIIAAGRRCSPVARHIKTLNNGNTFLVQIMYPGDTGLDEFDLVCTPRHDEIKGGANKYERKNPASLVQVIAGFMYNLAYVSAHASRRVNILGVVCFLPFASVAKVLTKTCT